MAKPFISYAQSFEDVMLWRALGDVETGFYIDVGAYSPDVDSVTRAFYERGWRGINIEPNPAQFEAFVTARPRDVNLRLAVSDRDGAATISLIPGSGLSTLSEVEASRHAEHGRTVTRADVETTTLASLWATQVPKGQDVHFLKVDVEGHERQVLAGNDWAVNRPWIVVAEATRPGSQEPAYDEWEAILTDAGYTFAYADGLNRYYVAPHHPELLERLRYPPNVFDGFVRAREHDAVTRLAQARQGMKTAGRPAAVGSRRGSLVRRAARWFFRVTRLPIPGFLRAAGRASTAGTSTAGTNDAMRAELDALTARVDRLETERYLTGLQRGEPD